MTARRRRADSKGARPARRQRPAPARRLDPGEEIAQLRAALAAETDPARGLDHLLTIARRVTGAEAGTVYLRRGDTLEFAAVQNEALARRQGEAEVRKLLAAKPLSLRAASIASYVVLTRATVNLSDAYDIPMDRPYTLFRAVDRDTDYRTRSMLATPLRDAQGRVFGVLQLINAVDGQGQVGAFTQEHQTLVQSLAALAAQLRLPPATR